ncbi:hypothetical protein NQ317_015714 [Molorchus minor]|uniref:Enoyl reductase (ER) domain-containing protein n=1 Tax=Molorchus minor TaxID=1323400 RepID=A0ABQ9JN04_9CUCU|nr:hypothetical protein NQ317_015714 [Molorchus minor]
MVASTFFDLYTRQGLLPHRKLPFVLGMECTGTITALGVEDTDLKVGQKVICYDYNGGLYREKLRVKPENCYLLPDFVDLKIGASLFVNYVTAYVSLFEIGNLRKNENVLIMSCAGGVGCAATQLAKTIEGVQIFGTGSKQKEEEAKGNGVDVFYAYDTFQSEAAKNKFDIIVTNQTGPILTFLQGILNPLGRIVITGAANLVPNETKISVFSLLKVWWSMKNISIESLIMNNRIVAGLHMGTLIECDREKVKTALNYIF